MGTVSSAHGARRAMTGLPAVEASEVSVTLRLTAEAWEAVRRVVESEGLSQRSALQCAIECVALFCVTPERRRAVLAEAKVDAVLLEEAVAAGWAEARRLQRRIDAGDSGRDRAWIPYAEGHLIELRGNCLDVWGVGINAAVSAVFTDWGRPELEGTRREVWRWARRRGRQRDGARRLQRAVLPLGDGLRLP